MGHETNPATGWTDAIHALGTMLKVRFIDGAIAPHVGALLRRVDRVFPWSGLGPVAVARRRDGAANPP